MLQVNKFDLKLILNPNFLLIFSALFLSSISDQWLQNKLEVLISSKDGLTGMVWVWGGLSILSAIFFPVIVSIFCAYVLVTTNQKMQEFLESNFELSLIETLRAWGKTFLWSFVFLIPGVIKYINYILTPFVVLFSKRYKKGEVDALEYSTLISKHFFWKIKLWLGLFFVIIPLIFYLLFDEYRIFKTNPFSATLLVFVSSVVQLLFHFVILKLFIKYLNEVENGAHV